MELIDQQSRIEFPTPAEASQPSPAPPWTPPWPDLPLDVTANILQRLDAAEILMSAQLVCTTWRNICRNPSLWRKISIECPDYSLREYYTTMCRRAVDRSRGQLTDLTIVYCGDDELLNYVACRYSHLRRLTLARCRDISAWAVAEAIKKLPQLEELHLIRIFGNNLNNEGLQAILDGCPHIESLDLRRCYGVDLGGALGIRCLEQIKHLRLPSDSIDDYEWDADANYVDERMLERDRDIRRRKSLRRLMEMYTDPREREWNLIDLLNKIELPTPAAPPLTDLPLEVTANILQRLGAVEILKSAQYVCATWWNICRDPTMWRVISIECPNFTCKDYCTMMCRRAVNRSQGQLIDLTIAYFGDQYLLDYIVSRSSHLRRLTLVSCRDILARAIDKAVEKLPELEELNLIRPSSSDKFRRWEPCLNVSRSWSKLKAFTLDLEQWYRHNYYSHDEMYGDNDDARAIATYMPNLCHFRLYANGLDNQGLQAILDGCPHLDSLDLRECRRVDLGGALGMRCFEQIQHLRLPSDPVDENAWELDSVTGRDSPYYCSDPGCCGNDTYERDSYFDYDDVCSDYLDDDVWPIF